MSSKEVPAYSAVVGQRIFVNNDAFGGFYKIHNIVTNDLAGTITFGLDYHKPIVVSIGDEVIVK